jgi:hypothetical protein
MDLDDGGLVDAQHLKVSKLDCSTRPFFNVISP